MCGLVALAAIAICAEAIAQQPTAEVGTQQAQDEARAQFDVGVALFEKEQFDQAAVAFARAYELRPSFKILYNIAQTENELGHYAAALDAYTRYLSEGGEQLEAVRRDEVRADVARLAALVGAIAVEAGASDLAVFVDGRKVGTTPLPGPLHVDLGDHEVRLLRGAGEIYREVIRVAGGQLVAVKVDISSEAPGSAHPSPDPSPNSGRGGGGRLGTPAGRGRLWTWVALGAGGAAAIAAAVTGGIYVSDVRDIESRCDGNDCPASERDRVDAAATLGDATTALIAVAGAGLVAGVILYFAEPAPHRREEIELAPAAAAGRGGAAVALMGRF
jgi:tetratricopeptide (TPR) repeat protein